MKTFSLALAALTGLAAQHLNARAAGYVVAAAAACAAAGSIAMPLLRMLAAARGESL